MNHGSTFPNQTKVSCKLRFMKKVSPVSPGYIGIMEKKMETTI